MLTVAVWRVRNSIQLPHKHHGMQEALVACAEEQSQPHASLLEQLQELYSVLTPQIGAATFCQALAEVQDIPQVTTQFQACTPSEAPIAALLTALSAASGVLYSACKDPVAPSSDGEAVSAEGGNSSSIPHGILQLMQQCRIYAEHKDTPAAASIAALGALFAAVPVFAPLSGSKANTAFSAAAPMFAASALQILRTTPACRANAKGTSAAGGRRGWEHKLHNHLEREAGDSAVSMEADAHGMSARRSSDVMHTEDSGEDGAGMHVLCGAASAATASLIRALQGSPQELIIVDETVAVVNAVQLPSRCDERLLLAAFSASVQACCSSDAGGSGEGGSGLMQHSGLEGVAWRIAEAVAHDTQQSVQQMAAHLHVCGAHAQRPRASLDAACMDSQPSGASLSSSMGGVRDSGTVGDQAELVDLSRGLLKHLTRAAAMLGAARAGEAADEDYADSDADSAELTDAPQPPAVSLHLLSRLAGVVEPLSAVLCCPAVNAAVAGPLRRAWGKATVHAIALDVRAAEELLPCVFSVVAEAASVDVLVDWHDVLAAMMDAYLPRSAGFAQAADRILSALQTIWTLSELQVFFPSCIPEFLANC